jgi:hypothetical protein
MSVKLMTLHTLIIFKRWHSNRIQMEVTMNFLILTSLSISEFFEIHSFSMTYAGYFMGLCVFVLLNKNIAINKNAIPEVLV